VSHFKRKKSDCLGRNQEAKEVFTSSEEGKDVIAVCHIFMLKWELGNLGIVVVESTSI